jgi:hypothetical protein
VIADYSGGGGRPAAKANRLPTGKEHQLPIAPRTPHQLQVGDWVTYHVDAHATYYGQIRARDEGNSGRWVVDVYGVGEDSSPDTVSLDQARLTFVGQHAPEGVRETGGGSHQVAVNRSGQSDSTSSRPA